MKIGLGTGALLASIALAGFSGCKTKPECESLGTCGGELFGPASSDFYRGDGLRDQEWVIKGEQDNQIFVLPPERGGDGVPDFCQDQLQVPPTPLTLLRQPPVQATDRPPDKVTADWCSNIVFTPQGKVNRFIVWAPPFPLKVGLFTVSEDSANGPNHTRQGTYRMEITYLQTRPIEFTETCLTSQGIRLQCPELGRRLGEFLKTEANIYNARCWDPGKDPVNPDPARGGCLCEYDVSFIGGPTGRWYSEAGSSQITFFDDFFSPPSQADYCIQGASATSPGILELTGHDTTALFNQKSYRTMRLRPPTCDDGIQSHALGETGVDCGGMCEKMDPAKKCGTCSDGVRNGDEDGIDCGGSCLGVLCSDPGVPMTEAQKNQRPAACANGKQDRWEEGVDCGGPCQTVDHQPKLCTPTP
jgi:hypothetical protein